MAAATTKINTKVEDTNVTLEDQQCINTFARKNGRLLEIKADIEEKKKSLRNIEDACDELLMLDDDSTIPYKIGEVFVNLSSDEVQSMLEKEKEKTEEEIKGCEDQCTSIQEVLDDLKVRLYAKFGKNINLDADDD
ncbi:prefoldin subunit 4 [Exaiptasia diaphana]|uniref:Prefoldin subunit 4 n=1 Tax=Exaiptasia diaphana TaxID=2652724 RepID=A0A913WRF1_EXADI|nr:prefoldin subunit 4 [Exaiptasia diaphana]KXJ18487.1 Prefoldin subunit 4 [Exaiptasia diaphana]